MLRALTALASPGGTRAKLTAFIFHRVLAKVEALMPSEPDAENFKRILSWIEGQFLVLEPLDACRRMMAGALPPRAAIITFDDGYRDNFDLALPILQSRSLPAAFFVASGFSEGSAMFNDRIFHAVRDSERGELVLSWLPGGPVMLDTPVSKSAALKRLIAFTKYLPTAVRDARVASIVDAAGADAPSGLMMDPLQLRMLASAGMTIGGHTRHHPILRSLSVEDARIEIEGGMRDLIDMTGCHLNLFAYPNGRLGQDYNIEHVELVRRAGFEFAFSTEPGASTRSTDPLQLRRFTPWDRQHVKFSIRAIGNLFRQPDAGRAA